MVCDFQIGNWPIIHDNEKHKGLQKLWLKRSTPYNHHEALAVYYDVIHETFEQLKDVFHHSILYEDLNMNSLEEAKKLLIVMNLDPNLAGEACKAFENDSQNGLLGKRGKGSIRISNQMIVEIDAALKECGSTFNFDTDIDLIRQFIKISN